MKKICYEAKQMIWTALIISVFALLGILSVQFLGKGNHIEEICEEVIQFEIKDAFDLTQESQEGATPSVQTDTCSILEPKVVEEMNAIQYQCK